MGSLGPTSPTPPAKPRALVVFDYDFSLVNDDSDAFFCKQFCPDLLGRLDTPPHTPPPLGWPAMMDAVLGEFARRRPDVTRDEIVDALAKIPLFPEMLDAIRLAVDQHEATVAIISDANTVFIGSMLVHQKLQRHVTEVHTNVASWDGARLRVTPYHADGQEPHGCERCPRNMCKGRILDTLRSKQQYDVVLYVGDGIGDFCPSTRLTRHTRLLLWGSKWASHVHVSMLNRDTVFARANGTDGKSFGLLHRIEIHADEVVARVVQWHTGSDIYRHFGETLSALRA